MQRKTEDRIILACFSSAQSNRFMSAVVGLLKVFKMANRRPRRRDYGSRITCKQTSEQVDEGLSPVKSVHSAKTDVSDR